jgi:phage gp29-like protein
MNWTNEDIIKSFNGVIKDSRNLNSEDLEKKYFNFKNEVEPLYRMAINAVSLGNIQESFTKLEMMLKARKNMQDGKMTKLTTDIFVGNQLGKEYIYPKTNTPSADDYKKAINQITQKVKQNEEEKQNEESD